MSKSKVPFMMKRQTYPQAAGFPKSGGLVGRALRARRALNWEHSTCSLETILNYQFPRPATRGEGQGEGLLIKRSNDFFAPPLPDPLLHWRGGEGEENLTSEIPEGFYRAYSTFNFEHSMGVECRML